MEKIDNFFKITAKQLGYRSSGNVKFFLNTLLGDIDFKDKKVLDIGGGSGILTLYAGLKGAKRSICLEPESDGSHSGMSDQFNKMKELLGLDNVSTKPLTFQAFESEEKYFDIILLYNSVNHLDEMSCSNLIASEEARVSYTLIFKKLENICKHGASIIVCDCSNKNFFAKLGVRKPFDPSINYSLHQAPGTWAKLLLTSGFVDPKITWSSYNSFRTLGRRLLGNKILSYFLSSHFCLRMKKL